MRTMKILAVCSLFMAILVGCGAKGDSYDNMMSKKTLVVGVSADYPPFEFHKTVDGKDQIVGFDIDLANEMAKDLGVEMKIEDMKFESLIGALNSDKLDMVISGMDPNPERAKAVDFSDPYYLAEAGIIVRAADKEQYKTPEDLRGKKIGVQKGSTFENVVTQIPEAQPELLSKVSDLVLALESNRIEAVIVEKPVAQAYASNRPELEMSDAVLQPASDGYVIGFRKGSPKMVEAANNTIARLKSEGKLDEFITKATQMAEEQ